MSQNLACQHNIGHTWRNGLLGLAIGCLIAWSAPALAQLGTGSDTDLFRTNVPPNILLVVDNSKSMTNQVWHSDFGNSTGAFKWKTQTECTYFRDAFAASTDTSGEFKIYPGGRKVNYVDTTGWVVRTRGNSPAAWEPQVLDAGGNPIFNDANANGVQDVGEWNAYYKTCNPAGADYANNCLVLPDYDSDGTPGQTVRDAFGNPIIHGGTGLTQDLQVQRLR